MGDGPEVTKSDPEIVITTDDHPDLLSVLQHWLTSRPDSIEYVEVEDGQTGEVYRLSGEVLRYRYSLNSEVTVDMLDNMGEGLALDE